jgi:hypothetical protein
VTVRCSITDMVSELATDNFMHTGVLFNWYFLYSSRPVQKNDQKEEVTCRCFITQKLNVAPGYFRPCSGIKYCTGCLSRLPSTLANHHRLHSFIRLDDRDCLGPRRIRSIDVYVSCWYRRTFAISTQPVLVGLTWIVASSSSTAISH